MRRAPGGWDLDDPRERAMGEMTLAAARRRSGPPVRWTQVNIDRSHEPPVPARPIPPPRSRIFTTPAPKPVKPPPPASPVSVDPAVAAVLQVTGVDWDAFASKSRTVRTIIAREICVAVGRELGYSFPQIARAMARPNHSTAVTALHRFDRRKHEPVEFYGTETTRQELGLRALAIVRAAPRAGEAAA